MANQTEEISFSLTLNHSAGLHVLTKQMLTQRSIGQELVDKRLLSMFVAETNQTNEVPMVHSRQELNLILELYRSLHRSLVSPFHGRHNSAWKLRSVDLP